MLSEAVPLLLTPATCPNCKATNLVSSPIIIESRHGLPDDLANIAHYTGRNTRPPLHKLDPGSPNHICEIENNAFRNSPQYLKLPDISHNISSQVTSAKDESSLLMPVCIFVDNENGLAAVTACIPLFQPIITWIHMQTTRP